MAANLRTQNVIFEPKTFPFFLNLYTLAYITVLTKSFLIDDYDLVMRIKYFGSTLYISMILGAFPYHLKRHKFVA